MRLDMLREEEIAALTIPTGIPLVYRLTSDLRPIDHRYLGEPAELEAAVTRVISQGRARTAARDHEAEGSLP
jgi:2,3-bisphosphoglycerate-dependent phosphoglycerate mutase